MEYALFSFFAVGARLLHPEINSGNHFHANNFMPGFGIARPSRKMNGI